MAGTRLLRVGVVDASGQVEGKGMPSRMSREETPIPTWTASLMDEGGPSSGGNPPSPGHEHLEQHSQRHHQRTPDDVVPEVADLGEREEGEHRALR